jgi:hypothetical protein
VSLIFERRTFCRYVCPVGGFIGLYAKVAPVEVRVKDPVVCAGHREKTCYTGSAEGYGCPWQVYPGTLSQNTYCGTCLECLRTCPKDNVAVNLRLPGADLRLAGKARLDEAYKAFIMLGCALAYSAVMLGPWASLKAAAYAVGSGPWLAYAAGLAGLTLAGLPGLFWLAVWVGRRWARGPQGPGAQRETFAALAHCLVPLGLAAWVAFSLAFVFANLSYVWPVVSDPFGWGWNWLGTAGWGWTPYLTGYVAPLQALVLTGGLAWAGATARHAAGERVAQAGAAWRLAAPVAGYCLVATVALLWLLMG